MYFIPRHNKVFSTAATIRPRYRYALTVCMLSAVFLLWYVGVYGYLQHMTDSKLQESNNMSQQTVLCTQADAGCQQLQKSIQALQTVVDAAAQNNQASQQSMLWLINQASACGVVTNACAIDCEDNQGWCARVHAAIDMQGTMPQLLKFFAALRGAKQLVALDSISIARVQGDLFSVKGGVGFIDLKRR